MRTHIRRVSCCCAATDLACLFCLCVCLCAGGVRGAWAGADSRSGELCVRDSRTPLGLCRSRWPRRL